MRRGWAAMSDGAVGGAVGTAAMSGVMLAARRAGAMTRQPPEAITAAALDAVGEHRQNATTRDALAVVLHFGFGVGVGALFGVLQGQLPAHVRRHPALSSMAYATLVWAVSYQGWVPALGILPPATRDEPGRPLTMLLAHWVYGATLGVVICERDSHGDRHHREV